MIFDPMYLLMMAPVIIFAMAAQFMVKSRFEKYSRIRASSNITGAEAAALMLRQAGIANVRIEQVAGTLSDHYDPGARVVRLSNEVYSGRSIAALAVACHEVGHAIQHARKYAPLVLRNVAVPIANFGSGIGYIMILAGFFLQLSGLAWAGVALFSTVFIFQLVNLPVEFNASTRAKEMLGSMGLVQRGAEAAGVSAMLGAAAMTYVAATAQSLMQLLYFVMLLLGQRRSE